LHKQHKLSTDFGGYSLSVTEGSTDHPPILADLIGLFPKGKTEIMATYSVAK
jgi:hypothetical protein